MGSGEEKRAHSDACGIYKVANVQLELKLASGLQTCCISAPSFHELEREDSNWQILQTRDLQI